MEEVQAQPNAAKKWHSLNTLIGLRDKTEKTAKGSLADMMQKFKSKQGLFKGSRNTFQAHDGYVDQPAKRGYVKVASTVKEQLDYMAETLEGFLKIAFSIEKTNASGAVMADLFVEGVHWGTYSSLELLRMRSFLEASKLKSIYSVLPTRTLTERWAVTTDTDYADMEGIFETPLEKGHTKTTLKTEYILEDPHPSKDRKPVVGTRDKQVNTGEYTVQRFSGELNISQVAIMQKRLDTLHTAVIEALSRANEVDAKESDLGTKLFEYLHQGI